MILWSCTNWSLWCRRIKFHIKTEEFTDGAVPDIENAKDVAAVVQGMLGFYVNAIFTASDLSYLYFI